jgi:hypothetical protein
VEYFARLPLLDEARAKLLRGKTHLYLLEAELMAFWESKPYPIVYEYDAKNSKNLFRLKIERRAPVVEWGLIIGDAVHNARSALDYIAWRLAGSVLADRHTFCDSSASFDKSARGNRLSRVHPEAIKAIREFQPYTRPDPKHSALWLLEELDRRDKHKLLTPIQCLSKASKIAIYDPLPVTLPFKLGSRLEDNAVIVEVPGPPNPHVHMELELSIDILFERGLISDTADFEIRGNLFKLFEGLDEIIARFNASISRNPHWLKSF